MLFHINSEDLGHILSSVAPIADMGATVEQMCVYIEALDSGCVRFSATDMNNSVRHTKSALITEVGTCLVSARKLQALVKTLPSQAVEIKTDGQEVKISCGKIKANIPSLDPSLFDPLVFVDTSCGIEMPFDEFSDIVKSCVKNVATKDDRPAITCVHIHAVGNRLIFTATDSFKVYEGFANCAKPVEFDALVPAVFLSKVAALKAGKTIKFAIDHNQIAFSDGEIEIGSSLNMGKYPNLKVALSYNAYLNVVVSTAALRRAVERANSVRSHTVRLEAQQGVLKITGISKDDGTTYEEIECECSSPEYQKAYLNSSYLQQYIGSLLFNKVTLSFCGENRPLGISSDYSNGIVMPVRAPEGW